MVSHGRERPKLTAKGERVRARIVSGSQLCHYFPDKDDLVQAVAGYQADTAISNQRQADLGVEEACFSPSYSAAPAPGTRYRHCPRPRAWELNTKPNLRTREPASGAEMLAVSGCPTVSLGRKRAVLPSH